jgi:hypothetical protein
MTVFAVSDDEYNIWLLGRALRFGVCNKVSNATPLLWL